LLSNQIEQSRFHKTAPHHEQSEEANQFPEAPIGDKDDGNSSARSSAARDATH
jgi:putative IMPACT (imprinted ancient) family translation regulator